MRSGSVMMRRWRLLLRVAASIRVSRPFAGALLAPEADVTVLPEPRGVA
jgi:hypothetical protein